MNPSYQSKIREYARKGYRYAVILLAVPAMLAASQAEAVVIDSYFGWNYVSSNVVVTGNTLTIPELQLTSVSYTGAHGPTSLTMPVFSGYSMGMPDGTGVNSAIGTYTNPIIPPGDGETTRTVFAPLSIDWVAADTTHAFPTISITSITAYSAQSGSVTVSPASPYIVGLIPMDFINNELGSSLGSLRTDIYNQGRKSTFSLSLPPGSGVTGSADFIFSAAAVDPIPTPIPSAVWLFSSGLPGLIGIARRRKAG